MARKANKTQQDQANTKPEVNPETSEKDEANTQPEADQEKSGEAESASETEQQPKTSENKANARTKVRMVDAVLKTRHCRGGNCKEAGDTMAMTEGEYDRLKKYDRVE